MSLMDLYCCFHLIDNYNTIFFTVHSLVIITLKINLFMLSKLITLEIFIGIGVYGYGKTGDLFLLWYKFIRFLLLFFFWQLMLFVFVFVYACVYWITFFSYQIVFAHLVYGCVCVWLCVYINWCKRLREICTQVTKISDLIGDKWTLESLTLIIH